MFLYPIHQARTHLHHHLHQALHPLQYPRHHQAAETVPQSMGEDQPTGTLKQQANLVEESKPSQVNAFTPISAPKC